MAKKTKTKTKTPAQQAAPAPTTTRRVAISSGHGLHIRGASGNPVPPQVDEVDEARRMVDRVAELLGCVKFHDNSSTSQSQNLDAIVRWHNQQSRDLDVSFHLNCYNHSANGCEVLYVTQETLASQVCNAIVAAGGFTNRGAKYRSDLAFLNGTDKPAILLETFFCDHTGDCNKYHDRFEEICHAIAESISGQQVEAPPPGGGGDRPDRPERPEDPTDIPVSQRPVLGEGDEGPDVGDLQTMLNDTVPNPRLVVDEDFGGLTDTAVRDYQRTRGLDVDGLVGEQTWTALYENRPPLPPPPPPPHAIGARDQAAIMDIANSSSIANYSWDDRGVAPRGYTQGMALSFAQTYLKLKQGHRAAVEMAKARTDSDKDALDVYRSDFSSLGMSNESDGIETLRHLYALMLGSGMRESSGRHCEGRDQSADNVSSDTAEAGLFQTSFNAHSASDPEFSDLMDEYSTSANKATCYLDAFDDEVSCGSSDWDCYGSGAGYHFQKLCKECPAFAVETHGLTLRNLCNHYGPIIRKEVELKREADTMFREVQTYVDGMVVSMGTEV